MVCSIIEIAVSEVIAYLIDLYIVRTTPETLFNIMLVQNSLSTEELHSHMPVTF